MLRQQDRKRRAAHDQPPRCERWNRKREQRCSDECTAVGRELVNGLTSQSKCNALSNLCCERSEHNLNEDSKPKPDDMRDDDRYEREQYRQHDLSHAWCANRVRCGSGRKLHVRMGECNACAMRVSALSNVCMLHANDRRR